MGHRMTTAAAAALLCSTSIPSLAQGNTAPQSGGRAIEGGGFQEIVVTARRRSESAQNVPTAIQAINSEALIQRGIRSEADLQTAVPGLVIRSGLNNNFLNYVIRGESVEPYSGSSPGVQPYFNDVALSGNTATAFYDVESVQVLKGPQGTLFGRNSTGGAVLYQSAAPRPEIGGFASVQYGNYDKLIAEGALNLPLVEDRALLRVAGTYQSGGAYVRNIYDGRRLGDNKVRSGRVTLKLMPTDSITNNLMVQYGKFSGSSNGNRLFYVDPCGATNPSPAVSSCWAVPGNPAFDALINSAPGTFFPGYPNGSVYAGGVPALPGYLSSLGKYYVANNAGFDFQATDVLVTNGTTFELSDTLTIKNIFGYARTKRGFGYDNDGTPYPLLQAGGGAPGGNDLETRNTRILSDELQLQGKAIDDRLTYIIGLFYADQKTFNNSPITGLGYNPGTGALTPPFAIRYKSTSKDESKAVFTQGTFAVTDRLNLTAGIRQTWDKLSLEQLQGSVFFGTPVRRTKQNDISWTASVDYRFSSSLMVYITTRGSWRVGGYNPFLPGTGNTTTAAVGGNYFPPETVRDVEIGAKFNGRIGGMPVRMNLDVFNSWIRNIQKSASAIINGRITSNTITVPAGKVTGFEFDGDILPTDWLRLGMTFSYNNARFTDKVGFVATTPVTFGPFADAPKYSGTAYGEVTIPLGGNAGSLLFHVDGFAQSLSHLSSLGDTVNPGDKLPGYILLNARLDWSDPLGARGFTASLFAKNITQDVYYVGGSGGVLTDAKSVTVYGAPRTYGAALRYTF